MTHRHLHTNCMVCGRVLKNRHSQEVGAGNTCIVNSFERSIPAREREAAMEKFKLIRLAELQKKAKKRKAAKKKSKVGW